MCSECSSLELYLILTLTGGFWRKKKLLEAMIPSSSLEVAFISVLAPRLFAEG